MSNQDEQASEGDINTTSLNIDQKYKSIYVTKNQIDKDILCDVCLDDIEDEEGNDCVVICDLCNGATH